MVVDSLLKLVTSQGADALILPPTDSPFLQKRGEKQPLSMPSLGAEVLAMVLEEVTDAAARERLEADGHVESTYALDSGERFAVVIEKRGGGHKFTFRSGSAPAPKPARPTAAARRPTRPDPSTVAPVAKPAPPAAPPRPAPAVVETHAPEPALSTAPRIEGVLARAAYEDASDVFFSSGRDACMRVGGELVALEGTTFEPAELLELLDAELSPAARTTLEATGSVDLSMRRVIDGSPHRYRANLFRHVDGLGVALRPIREHAPTLEELGLPADFHELVAHPHGLVLMTGTTGAGKSTTLVALVEHVNRTAPRHVITIEDPVEYTYGPGRALVHQREVGRDVESFGAGLRAALRESPDIILLGEMRDPDTIAAALTAAETGHLVLSTLHCGHAAMAIDRIIDAFPPHQQTQVRLQLAAVLRAVITQVLLPSTRPPRRVPAYEKLVVNTAVAAKIREGRGHQLQSEIQKGRADGMVPLEATLAQLVRHRRISMGTATSVAVDPQLLAALARG